MKPCEAVLGSTVSDPDAPPLARRRRPWPLVPILGVAVLAGALAIGWFVWVPNWRPPLENGERYGIDVSAHQDAIDWREVANDDIAFAYIKATEGGDLTDDRFEANWRGAQEQDLIEGPITTSPCAHAVPTRLVTSSMSLHPRAGLSLPQSILSSPATAAPDRVWRRSRNSSECSSGWSRQRGREVILYVGDDFEQAYPVRQELDRPLWLRRFLLRPDVEGWLIWQLHGYARVHGIDGGVDLDVMRASP